MNQCENSGPRQRKKVTGRLKGEERRAKNKTAKRRLDSETTFVAITQVEGICINNRRRVRRCKPTTSLSGTTAGTPPKELDHSLETSSPLIGPIRT